MGGLLALIVGVGEKTHLGGAGFVFVRAVTLKTLVIRLRGSSSNAILSPG